MMRAKVHRATVTGVNLEYEGSMSLDTKLMDELDILPNEMVQVLNINTGARFETYVIPGLRNSGEVALNGAAARLAQPGDKIIAVFYAQMADSEARSHKPRVAIVDERNRTLEIRQDVQPVAANGRH